MAKKSVALVVPGGQEVSSNPGPRFNTTTILLIALVILAAYFIWKKRGSIGGSYKNEENWRINEFNADGIPSDITISRHFTRE